MSDQVLFPIRVYFENGEIEEYEDINHLEMNLEEFDSDIDRDCRIIDKLDRPVRLKLKYLEVKSISLEPS